MLDTTGNGFGRTQLGGALNRNWVQRKKGCGGKERPTRLETPLEQKEKGGNSLASPLLPLAHHPSVPPIAKRNGGQLVRGAWERVLQGRHPALQGPAGWAVDSASLPQLLLPLFSISATLSPFYHGMLKQCDWVESFAPALSANHSAALTIKYECVTMRA